MTLHPYVFIVLSFFSSPHQKSVFPFLSLSLSEKPLQAGDERQALFLGRLNDFPAPASPPLSSFPFWDACGNQSSSSFLRPALPPSLPPHTLHPSLPVSLLLSQAWVISLTSDQRWAN